MEETVSTDQASDIKVINYMTIIKGEESLVLGDFSDVLYITLISGFGDQVNSRTNNVSEMCSL